VKEKRLVMEYLAKLCSSGKTKSASYLLSPKDEVLLSLSQLVSISRGYAVLVLRTMRTPTQTPTPKQHNTRQAPRPPMRSPGSCKYGTFVFVRSPEMQAGWRLPPADIGAITSPEPLCTLPVRYPSLAAAGRPVSGRLRLPKHKATSLTACSSSLR